MSHNDAIRVRDLPPEARRRAEAFIEEGDYYGWQLQGVAARPLGDLLQCTLEFDSTRIIFLAHPDARYSATSSPWQSPGLRTAPK